MRNHNAPREPINRVALEEMFPNWDAPVARSQHEPRGMVLAYNTFDDALGYELTDACAGEIPWR